MCTHKGQACSVTGFLMWSRDGMFNTLSGKIAFYIVKCGVERCRYSPIPKWIVEGRDEELVMLRFFAVFIFGSHDRLLFCTGISLVGLYITAAHQGFKGTIAP